jgi:hypothetical protein
MFIGLLVTFATGYIVSISETMLETVFYSNLYWVFIVAEIALVVFFSIRVRKMSPTTAKICFLLYSFVSGLTFSSIFVLFELDSVMMVFLIAALVFGLFGLIGYKTNTDLGNWGTILLMGLLAVIICSIINVFLGNDTFDLIVSIVTLVVFFGYTAYDIQKIKELSEENIDNDVVAINGAFELYLDFINIFIQLLKLIGDAKD